MTTQKICPQCKTTFDGRSNQLYCSPLCKQRAFHTGKVNDLSNGNKALTEPSQLYQTPTVSSDPKMETFYETLRLESAERIKRLELEDREQEREYELERERQEFERERERMKWEQETIRLKADQITQEKQQALGTFGPDEEESDQEENSGIGAGTLVLLGIGGLLLAKIFNDKPKEKSPAAPPATSLDDIAKKLRTVKDQKNGLKTDS